MRRVRTVVSAVLRRVESVALRVDAHAIAGDAVRDIFGITQREPSNLIPAQGDRLILRFWRSFDAAVVELHTNPTDLFRAQVVMDSILGGTGTLPAARAADMLRAWLTYARDNQFVEPYTGSASRYGDSGRR